MAAHRFRLLVFDCDGTLVDSQHGIVACMTEACRRTGLTGPLPEAIRRVVGPSLEHAIGLLFPDCAPAMHDEIAVRYREVAQAFRRNGAYPEPLYPGIREALEALGGPGVAFGIATGRNRRGLLHTLASHGLDRLFTTLQTPDSCRGKPDPEMLERAMAETGSLAETTVFIGDTSFDMQMARNAGTAAVGAGWGYHGHHELIGAGAEAIAAAPSALPALLGVLERTA
jgi:phosphoglycolate phosphatase